MGNHIRDNTLQGIRIFQDPDYSLIGSNMVIKNNVLSGNATSGYRGDIEVDALDSEISKNYLSNPGTGIVAAIMTNYGSGQIFDNTCYNYDGMAGVVISPGWKAWNNVGSGTFDITENSGAAANVTDGGTIAHGLVTTPTKVICTPSVAGEMVSVTGLNATNITIAIKKLNGTSGTPQTIYWNANV